MSSHPHLFQDPEHCLTRASAQTGLHVFSPVFSVTLSFPLFNHLEEETVSPWFKRCLWCWSLGVEPWTQRASRVCPKAIVDPLAVVQLHNRMVASATGVWVDHCCPVCAGTLGVGVAGRARVTWRASPTLGWCPSFCVRRHYAFKQHVCFNCLIIFRKKIQSNCQYLRNFPSFHCYMPHRWMWSYSSNPSKKNSTSLLQTYRERGLDSARPTAAPRQGGEAQSRGDPLPSQAPRPHVCGCRWRWLGCWAHHKESCALLSILCGCLFTDLLRNVKFYFIRESSTQKLTSEQ